MTENYDLVNNSGAGKDSPVCDLVAKKFNWGAFAFNFIWGIFNKSWITLISLVISFIPVVCYLNIFVSIWFGIKGNEWAWQNKRWESIEEFHKIQKRWAIAAAILLGLSVLGIVATMLLPALMTPLPR
jgi:hypothetical protein